MKKTRYIPYGYTIRNGITVVERTEAEIIKGIFEQYINGYSLKDIAGYLTAQSVPYTERKTEWNKARIARIIENSRYTGDEEYEPIIDEDVFENAVNCKTARQRNTATYTCEAIGAIRNRIKCAKCGAMMVRRYSSKYKVRENWQCSNPECGFRVRVSDGILLEKLTVLLNRIIENAFLINLENRNGGAEEPYHIRKLINELNTDMGNPNTSEDSILDRIREIAAERYKNSNAGQSITAQLVRKRIQMMKPQEEFNTDYFNDIVEYMVMGDKCELRLITKTGTSVGEEEKEDGSTQNTEEDGNGH